MTNYPFPQVCEAIKVPQLPEAYRSPIVSTVPTLFISGSLDSNTPPYQAEQVRWGFPEQRPPDRRERRATKARCRCRTCRRRWWIF